MSQLPSWQTDYIKTSVPCIFNSCSKSALHQQMVSHVQSWDIDSVLSHSHTQCPPVLITSLAGIMKLLNPRNIHLLDRTLLAVFKLIVFCMQHLWGSKYPFPQLSSPNRLYPAPQRSEIQKPRSALLTSQEYLHLEMSRFRYKCWYSTHCSHKSHSTPSLDSASARELTSS